MISQQRILLVAPSNHSTHTAAAWLESAGYDLVVKRGFAEGRAELATRPDIVISEIKLGPYNGLHLAILAGSLGTPAIVIGDRDPVLQMEAEHQSAVYVTEPVDPEHVLRVVRNLLTTAGHKRRSPRKRVPVLDALLNDMQAHLVDVSHEGMRIEALGGQDSLPATFTVGLPASNFSCRVERVWTSPAREEGTSTWCGAALSLSDIDTALAWRGFVDKMPGSSVMH
jgi:DNA-binding NtrC family response regulator